MSITVTKKVRRPTSPPEPKKGSSAVASMLASSVAANVAVAKPTGKAAMIASKPLLNASHFHQGAGVPDPLYRTWWFFESATKADGSVDSELAAAMSHVQVMFTDGQSRYFDRMPRRSAKAPVVTFMCYHNKAGQRFQPLGDYESLPPQPYVVSVDSMALPDAHDHPVAAPHQQQPKVVPLKTTKQTFSGSITFDANATVPPDPMARRLPHGGAAAVNANAQKPPAQYLSDVKEAKEKAAACRNSVCTSDMAGGLKESKCTVKFSLHREPKANTLEIVHPNGTTIHFTTEDKLPTTTATATATTTAASAAAPASAAAEAPKTTPSKTAPPKANQ